MITLKVLTVNSAKLLHTMENDNVLSAALYLAPHALGLFGNLCKDSTPGCRVACLYTSGRAGIIRTGERSNPILNARMERTRRLFQDRERFLADIRRDVERLAAHALTIGARAALRLNGTSDIDWRKLAPGFLESMPRSVTLYDYTKDTRRILGNPLKRYRLALSRSESNERDCRRVLSAGHRVAVVFDVVPVGSKYLGQRVINGDRSDAWYLQRAPCIIGLRAKGRAKRDASGFVVRS